MTEETKMMTPNPTSHVKDLVAKAGQAFSAEDAMRFSQAALNAAKALSELKIHELDL